MNIKLDKTLTTLAQADKVKADMKEFKGTYKDGDLLGAFSSQVEEHRYTYFGDVLRTDVEAYPSGWMRGDETSFHVTMWTTTYITVYRLSFHVDLGLGVNVERDFSGRPLWSVEAYDKRGA